MLLKSIPKVMMIGFAWMGIPYANAADNDDLKSLLQARLDVAIRGFESSILVHDRCMWSKRILETELSLSQSTDERIKTLENELHRSKKLEKMVGEGFKQENYTLEELMEVKYLQLDIDYRLVEEKAKKSAEEKAKKSLGAK